MNYPTDTEVASATHERICEWYRFLESPRGEEQERILFLILTRYREGGGMTPQISKKIGWGS